MYTDACSCLWQFHWQRLIAKLSEFRALPQRTSLPHAGAKNSFINVLLYIIYIYLFRHKYLDVDIVLHLVLYQFIFIHILCHSRDSRARGDEHADAHDSWHATSMRWINSRNQRKMAIEKWM